MDNPEKLENNEINVEADSSDAAADDSTIATDDSPADGGDGSGSADTADTDIDGATTDSDGEADADAEAEAEAPPEAVFRRKIIVVDDLFLHLTSIKNRLQSHYEIYPAQSVTILFKLLDQFIPDLVLLDVNMPETNGFQVLEMMKMNIRFADIPVIFLTGSSDRASVAKGLKLGAADFISKPFDDKKLIASIEKQFQPAEAEGEKPVVLAIDDTPAVLQAVYNTLQDAYKVYTLPKPEKMEGLLKVLKPDLFLLDYNMPVLNGFELVPIIRRHPDHAKTPIIFLTSEGTLSNINEAIRLGASDFILKPASDEVLRDKVAALLRK